MYALARGRAPVGGYEVRDRVARQVAGIPTVGKNSNGAIVEKELPIQSMPSEIYLYLDSPSFGMQVSQAIDASTIKLRLSFKKKKQG